MSSIRLIVTGGAVFIGSYLVERLLKEGYKVTIIDNLTVDVYNISSVGK